MGHLSFCQRRDYSPLEQFQSPKNYRDGLWRVAAQTRKARLCGRTNPPVDSLKLPRDHPEFAKNTSRPGISNLTDTCCCFPHPSGIHFARFSSHRPSIAVSASFKINSSVGVRGSLGPAERILLVEGIGRGVGGEFIESRLCGSLTEPVGESPVYCELPRDRTEKPASRVFDAFAIWNDQSTRPSVIPR